MIDNYISYVLLAISITLLPGPAVILSIKNSLLYGYKYSLFNILGNFIAMIIIAIISVLGLGAIILTSLKLYLLIKFLGAFYLIYLGLQFFKSSSKHYINISSEKVKQKDAFTIFKEGFFIGISNPKAITFFIALFPQFINPENPYIPQFVVLILTIEIISSCVLFAYAIFATLSLKFLIKEKFMKLINKIIGTSFILFGLTLGLKE